jgi:transcriptional regulator with XRE-family HTH domain
VPSEPTPTSIAIREHRLKTGKQKELAALVGVDTQTISRWENAVSEPSPENRERLRKIGVELPDVVEPAPQADRLERIEATLARIEAAVSELRDELRAGGGDATTKGQAVAAARRLAERERGTPAAGQRGS